MALSKVTLKTILLALVAGLVPSLAIADDPIPPEKQQEIIANYMFVTGQKGPISFAAAVHGKDTIPVKCGTSAVADFVLNRNRLDRRLMTSLGVNVLDRPVLDTAIISTGGHFKVHYTRTGIDSVYQSHVLDSRGVPVFVDSVAAIAERAWAFTIDTLGYPAPPSDGFYDTAGSEYDIFLLNLPDYYFGLTYLDSTQVDGPNSIRATSFLELDNDYQQVPGYQNRPLDAVRVTVAHEFFHAVQFGIDFSEAEVSGSGDALLTKRYWMEMSAVWMEEQQYTNINDYYSYLPYFFDVPMTSIQQFSSLNDLHPYGSVVLPLYLSQRFGRDIIRNIWLKCGTLGAGSNFLVAAQQSIIAADPTMNWPKAFAEFALWNYFTGIRAGEAPLDSFGHTRGYLERANYPEIPDSTEFVSGGGTIWRDEIQRVTTYPITQLVNGNLFLPECNAATYIRLTDVSSLADRYWARGASLVADSLCVLKYVDSLYHTSDSLVSPQDSSELSWNFMRKHCGSGEAVCQIKSGCTDTTLLSRDSIVSFEFSLGQISGVLPAWPWGLNIIYGHPSHLGVEALNDSIELASAILPPSDPLLGSRIDMYNKKKFSTITLIFTPTSIDYHDYTLHSGKAIAFIIPERKEIDSSYVNLPSAVLTPYPNPAVVSQMGGAGLTFRFQVQTDSLSQPVAGAHGFSIDIFNVAGERVRTLSGDDDGSHGAWKVSWDMKNAAGNDVASGVYIAVARLNSGAGTDAVVEQKVKVLIVR